MLQDAIAAELPYLRAQAEGRMTLTLTAYAPTTPTKDADGYDVPGYLSKGSTRGRIQGGAGRGADTQTRYVRIGETERPVLSGGLHIPISAPVPVAGEQRGQVGGAWEYEVTAVGPSDDPALLGRRYMVVEVPAKSHATARRLDVVQV